MEAGGWEAFLEKAAPKLSPPGPVSDGWMEGGKTEF